MIVDLYCDTSSALSSASGGDPAPVFLAGMVAGALAVLVALFYPWGGVRR